MASKGSWEAREPREYPEIKVLTLWRKAPNVQDCKLLKGHRENSKKGQCQPVTWGTWLRGSGGGIGLFPWEGSKRSNKHFMGKIRACASAEMTPGPIVLLWERPTPEVHLTPLDSQTEAAVGSWSKGCLEWRSSSLSASVRRGSLFHTTGPRTETGVCSDTDYWCLETFNMGPLWSTHTESGSHGLIA